jgi:hypothetical protein
VNTKSGCLISHAPFAREAGVRNISSHEAALSRAVQAQISDFFWPVFFAAQNFHPGDFFRTRISLAVSENKTEG